MSSQPVWITPAGSLGTVAAGSYYAVPLQVTDSFVANVSNATSTGSQVTLTFTIQSTAPFLPGDTVVVANISPTAYNGSYTVIKSTTSQVTFASTTTATYISGGTVSAIPSAVFFEPIAGSLPNGIEVTTNGIVQGTPTTTYTVADDVVVAGLNVTSKFAIRAYTKKTVNNITVINRLADRTFTLTVAGQNAPAWITPAGQIGQYWNGEFLSPGYQLQYTTDNTTGVPPAIKLIGGSLPPGLTLSDTGLISGYVGLNPSITVLPGFSVPDEGYDVYPFDFDVITQNANYQFTLQVTDGQLNALRAFSMFVWSTDTFNASTTLITADTTFLTASIANEILPIILNSPGSIGTAPNDTYFAYQFFAQDTNGDQMGYLGYNLPPGLTLDDQSGWLYGYLPTLDLTEVIYNFTIVAYIYETPEITSLPYNYTLTVSGPLSSKVIWQSPSNLGSIPTGGTSIFTIHATNVSGLALTYRLLPGSNSKLPQGLNLHPSGNICGRVGFNIDVPVGTTKTYTFTVQVLSINGLVNDTKTFTIDVLKLYDIPYDNLYIKCMPPQQDRDLIDTLLENVSIFPPGLIYRADDYNFGVSGDVVYYHAYGLNAISLSIYVEALKLNHYWKNLTLGQIETAQAVDPVTGKVIYEVVYSKIIDTLVNNEGESVGKEVLLPYPIENQTIDVVYPNPLNEMRDQVIDVVGQESNLLPLWMLSKQTDGKVLGFTPAWVIAYAQPGASGQIAYNIATRFGTKLNLIDFEADRYEVDNALTQNWDADAQEWIPTPPEFTTFDVNYHYDITIAISGTSYAVGDKIKILGTQIGGVTPLNDLIITVNTVSDSGAILDVFYEGTSTVDAADTHYDFVSGINTIGSGTGARWDVVVVPGKGGTAFASVQWINSANAEITWVNTIGDGVYWTSNNTTVFDTEFDGGSLVFVDPADQDTNTDAYDKYLLFPKSNIITPLPQYYPGIVYWFNDYKQIIEWVNNSAEAVPWIQG